MTGNLLLRCQYAFKTAAGLALAGQVPEAFVMQRSVLEHAGYCLTIYEKPELECVFVLRHLGPDEMKEQRETFKIGAVKEAVRRFEPTLANIFDENYQRSMVSFETVLGLAAHRGPETYRQPRCQLIKRRIGTIYYL